MLPRLWANRVKILAHTVPSHCRARFGKGRAYAYRLIKAGGVLNKLLEEGVKETGLPDSERLCRELAEFSEGRMKEVWKCAKELALANGKAKPEPLTIRAAAAN